MPSSSADYFAPTPNVHNWQAASAVSSPNASDLAASPKVDDSREKHGAWSPLSSNVEVPYNTATMQREKEASSPPASSLHVPASINGSQEKKEMSSPTSIIYTAPRGLGIAEKINATNTVAVRPEQRDNVSNVSLPAATTASAQAIEHVSKTSPIQEEAASAQVVPEISLPEDFALPDDPSIFCNSCERPVDAQSGIYMSRETLETNDYDNDDDEPSVWCTPCQAKSPKNHNDKMRVRVEGVWYGTYSAYRLFISREPETQDSSLVKAMKTRDLLRVEVLAEVPGLRDPADANGNAPIHIAAQLGLVKEAECLLKHDSLDLEARNVISHTPLGTAILAKNVAMIRLLLDHGAELSTFDRQKRMALHIACLSRSPEVVSMILGAVPARQLSTYVNQTRDDGPTALLTACKSGEIAIVELLLEARAEPNIRSGALWATNLLPTSQSGIAILHLLVDHGADLFAADAEGWTHLHVNAAFGRDDICSEILAIGTGRKQSMAADDDRSIKKRASRAAPSFNLDLKTKKGATALYLAAQMGHKDAARVLLEHGASADVAYEPASSRADWHTPLGIASAAGHEGLVAVLVKGGAPLDQVSNDNTALFLAARNGHLEVCRLLVEAGAGLEYKRQGESTAVFIAAKCGFVKVVRYLIDAGARDWPLNKAKTYLRLWFKSEVPSEIKSEIISILYDTPLRHF
jgi:ankyrin repeat protein